MNKRWFILVLAISSVAFALLATSSLDALAQGQANADGTTSYVLTASGTWGAAQNLAVRNARGFVQFSHTNSGIGIATSSDPGFLKKLLKSGAFSGGAEDMMVQWQQPANEHLADEGVVEEAVTPGDDRFINILWNMGAIDAYGAWAAGYDGAGVRVAVIDGGICSLHPDVAPNIDVAASRSFVTGFNYDDDTGGATGFRHACHVAGIIAAVDNTRGTIGVAPGATIIACKALHGGSGTFAAVIEAILYASDPISAGGAGANIINMSLGALFPRGGGNTGAGQLVAATAKAVNYATANNVLVVSAAGNAALDLDHSGSYIQVPAQSGSGIAVSATAPQDWAGGATNFRDPASYTNYGHSIVWVAAPGGDFAYPGNENCTLPLVSPPGVITRPCWVFDGVLSPGSQSGSYFWASGTSMAAPHVSGVAALIVQKYPGISVGDLKTLLSKTADDEGAIGADPIYGHGFVNARRAVTEPLASANRIAPPTAASGSAGARLDLAVTQFSGSSFSFILPTAGRARIELFDVAGRSVAVVYDGLAAAGRTTVAWNGQGAIGQLKRGAYFAKLSMGSSNVARKLVFLGQ